MKRFEFVWQNIQEGKTIIEAEDYEAAREELYLMSEWDLSPDITVEDFVIDDWYEIDDDGRVI